MQFLANEEAGVSKESLIENKFMQDGSFDCAPGAPVDLVTRGKTVTIKLKGKSGSKITSRRRPDEEKEAQDNVYWQLRTNDERASSVLVNIISARTGRSATMTREDTSLAVDGESGINGLTPWLLGGCADGRADEHRRWAAAICRPTLPLAARIHNSARHQPVPPHTTTRGGRRTRGGRVHHRP